MQIRPAIILSPRRRSNSRHGCGCGGCFVWMIAVAVVLIVLGALAG